LVEAIIFAHKILEFEATRIFMSSRHVVGLRGSFTRFPEAPCRNPRHVGGYLAKEKKKRRLPAAGRKGAISMGFGRDDSLVAVFFSAGDDCFI